MVCEVTQRVPSPEEFDSPADREATERALAYMALQPGTVSYTHLTLPTILLV